MDEALNIALQICDGLSAIHREGVAHRDLTPSNVILLPGGSFQIKVIDLGLSRSLRDHSEGTTQSVDGMLHYCSPEHVGLVPGVTPDPLSDQFALGVIAYQLISGRLPFKGLSTAGSLEARFLKRPRPLVARDVGVEVHPELAAGLFRAISYERNDRFPELPGLARVLRAALDDSEAQRAEKATEPTASPPPAPIPATSAPLEAEATRAKLPQEDPAEPVPQAPLPDAASVVDAIEASIVRAEFAKALERIEEVRDAGSMTPDLGSLELRAQMALRQQRHSQSMEARQMLDAYMAQRQDKLAALALETLLEVDPNVEDGPELTRRVEALTEQIARERLVDELLERGFERLHGGDVEGALTALLEVEASDPAAAARLRHSIDRHRIEMSQDERIEKLKRRAEDLLSRRRLGEVETVLESLAALGVPKLVSDVYRHRVEALREERAVDASADEIEARFRREMEDGQWAEARQVASDLELLLGQRERPARMREEIAMAEAEWRRQESIREGVERLENYLALGHIQEAEVALAIVQKLAPNHPRSADFEQQVRILRSNAHG